MHLETCHCHSSRELLAIGVGFSKGVLCDSHQRWGRQDALKSATATTHAQPFLVCLGLLNLKFWPKNTNQVIESKKPWPIWVTELTKLSHRKTSKFPLCVIDCKLRGATKIVSDKVFIAHKDGLKFSLQGEHVDRAWCIQCLSQNITGLKTEVHPYFVSHRWGLTQHKCILPDILC